MQNAVLIGSLDIRLNAGGGNEDQNPTYSDEAMEQVLAQENCVGTTSVNAVVNDSELGVVEATFKIGINANNEILDGDDNKVAMPCPCWCKQIN